MNGFLRSAGRSWLVAFAMVACGSSGSTNGVDGGAMAQASPDATRDGDLTVGPMGDASSEGAPAEAADASLGSACAAFAQAWCSRYSTCSAVSFGTTYGDVNTCGSRIATLYCAEELAAPGTGATPQQWLACASATALQTCDQWLTGSAAACDVPGSTAAGSPCEFNSQCVSTFCKRDTGSWCGTCQAPTPAGGTCDPDQSSCATGLRCADVGCSVPFDDAGVCGGVRTWSCVQPTPLGGPCVTPAQCAGSARCEGGTCSAPRQLGEACLDGETCALSTALECLPTGDAGNYSCVAISFVASGIACSPATGVLCQAGAVCRNSSGQPANVGTCRAPAADNQTCGASPCLAPAQCVNGTCQDALPAASCH